MAGPTFNVIYDGIPVLLLIKTEAGEAAQVARELARVNEQEAGRVWGVLWAAVVNTEMSDVVAAILKQGEMLSEIAPDVIANVDVIASVRAECEDDLRDRWLPRIRAVQASPAGIEDATPLAIGQYRPHNGY